MKKTAALLLFLFALVQAGPAVVSLFKNTSSVFVIDEEKTEDKTEHIKKEKKDITSFTGLASNFSHDVNIAFHLSEKIQSSPCLEKLTPPPNFC